MVSHFNGRPASLPEDLQEVNSLEYFVVVCLCHCLIISLHHMFGSDAIGHI